MFWKRKKNEGELAMYFIENDHEANILHNIFRKNQHNVLILQNSTKKKTTISCRKLLLLL